MKLAKSLPAVAAAFLSTASATRNNEQTVLFGGEEAVLAPINIAIIGAGAAGASSAYHLAQFAAETNLPVNITVFERNEYIGGRSTTVDAYDNPAFPVELGASIFVELNSILVDAVKAFNLSTGAFRSANEDIPGASLAVWDGSAFVVQQNSAGGWWDVAKLLWKYGWAPYTTMKLMRSTTGSFRKMYDAPVFPFASLTQAVEDVGLLSVVSATGEQYMLENGIKGDFGHDIVQASTRVNYAQNLKHIHGLEAMVCMAAEGAMSVEGGNWQIFYNMIAAAQATTLLGTQVTSMERKGDSYTVSFHSSAEDSEPSVQSALPAGKGDALPMGNETNITAAFSSQQFDAVILAAPLQFANLTLPPAPVHTPDEVPYVHLHVTLLTTPHLLSPAFFNLPASAPAPKVVLTTLPASEDPQPGPKSCGSPAFFSISLLRPVTNPHNGQPEYLYKIFSPSAPNATFLARILGFAPSSPLDLDGDAGISGRDISWLYRKVWESYPYEYPRVTFEEICLGEGLWYTSGVEGFISTMETSALMGRNVARLVVDEWVGRRGG
ncbi:hypothetical protein LTR08_008239 [Meristemomyces frigidus]|nr:hypothetical protein LTR08_008239 [Meristemomyces frigidus]